MARPRKRYIIFCMGEVEPVIYDGLEDAARRVAHLRAFEYEAAHRSFTNDLEAEEFLSWWNYERKQRA
jgi:hypothetical protein